MARNKLWAQMPGSCMPAEAKQITVPMRREDLQFCGRVIYCLSLLLKLRNCNPEYLVFQTNLEKNMLPVYHLDLV